MLALDKVEADQFAACLNQEFEIVTDKGALAAKLVEVHTSRGSDGGVRRQPFEIKFRVEPAVRLPQRIYRINHAVLGPAEIFLVQSACDGGGADFVAVFN